MASNDNISGDNILEANISYVEPLPEPVLPEETQDISKKSFTPIYVSFGSPVCEVHYEVQASGHRDKLLVTNNEVRLIHNRFYFIPVNNSTIDSDNFSIKVFSDVANLLDIRYVKHGVACVWPLRHNITLRDNQRLCVLF